MKITKLILHKNNLLHLLKGDTFILDITHDHVVIRGPSGVGKTTIVAELSPLPAIMKQYGKDGYKEIHIMHNQHQYILRSSGTKSGHHEFIMDDIDLNQSNNLTEQYSLVEQHFNYTKSIHDIMLGKRVFTRMTPSERRTWFSILSHGDTEFITKYWDKVSAGYREAKAVLKNIQIKIQEQTALMADESRIQELETKYQSFKQMDDDALKLQLSISQSETSQDVIPMIKRLTSQIEEEHINLRKQIMHYRTLSKGTSDITKDIQQNEALLISLNQQINQTMAHLEQLTTQEHLNKFEMTMTLPELESQIDANQQLQQQLYTQLDASLYTRFMERCSNHLDRAKSILNRALQQDLISHWIRHLIHVEVYPDLSTYDALKEKDNQLYLQVEKTKYGIETLTNKLNDLIKHKAQLSTEPEHVCPSCSFKFREATITERLNKLTQEIETCAKRIEKGEAILKEQEREYTNLHEQYLEWRKLHEFTIQRNELTYDFLKVISQEETQLTFDDLFRSPKKYLDQLHRLSTDLPL